MPIFRKRTHLPHSAEEAFSWHARPGAFERLTPPWVQVRVLKREGGLEDGGTLLLSVKQGPTDLKWKVRHTGFEEGRLFQDEQDEGPFETWVHAHRFIPVEEGGCFMEDEIEWTPPLGAAGRIFAEGFLDRELQRLFAFRHTRLENDLALHHGYTGKPLTVVLTGASGLIGTALTQFLTSGGHTVKSLRRSRRQQDDDLTWDPEEGRLEPGVFEGADAVVHLAGESLAAFRWTEEKKERILRSRREGTSLVAKVLAELKSPPPVFISASAVGFYGNRGNDLITEEAKPGKGFLAMVCREWEGATGKARKAGIRVVNLRTGFVVSPLGPGLGKMLPPFRAGLGGRIGTGRQYMSWIDLDDVVGLIHHALTRPGVSGPLNATAPNPVPNSAFTDALGRVLGRPTVVPLPTFAVRGMLGEMGAELLLKGARAIPQKAEETGYEFRFSNLEDSLRFQLGKIREE